MYMTPTKLAILPCFLEHTPAFIVLFVSSVFDFPGKYHHVTAKSEVPDLDFLISKRR